MVFSFVLFSIVLKKKTCRFMWACLINQVSPQSMPNTFNYLSNSMCLVALLFQILRKKHLIETNSIWQSSKNHRMLHTLKDKTKQYTTRCRCHPQMSPNGQIFRNLGVQEHLTQCVYASGGTQIMGNCGSLCTLLTGNKFSVTLLKLIYDKTYLLSTAQWVWHLSLH